ncbi:hypothetical protein J1N35_002727 [Gossypium stocksii]|uniref:Endonuclease/exonuclease/phosphatase domain-containing protein n=1 Tax=Gossypium stocksii TaxID=47602 RepID=A0A9D3WLI5_9ROSI|nr:hypothetical protein J1N35_002727 [Gossypium stocksii]
MSSGISIFSWNCQGCANEKFPRSFREYIREHKPNIVSLLEPRVSGRKADEVIAKIGLQYSHRVEARGFSGRIWLSWNSSLNLEILINHPQFILTRVSYGVPTQTILIIFVYRSPNRTKRTFLWEALEESLQPTSPGWQLVILTPSCLNMKRKEDHLKGNVALFWEASLIITIYTI